MLKNWKISVKILLFIFMVWRQFFLDVLPTFTGIFPHIAPHRTPWEALQAYQCIYDLYIATRDQLIGPGWEFFSMKHNAACQHAAYRASGLPLGNLADGFFYNSISHTYVPVQFKYNAPNSKGLYKDITCGMWKDLLATYSNQIVLLGVEQGHKLTMNAHHLCGHIPSNMVGDTARGLIQNFSYINNEVSLLQEGIWRNQIKLNRETNVISWQNLADLRVEQYLNEIINGHDFLEDLNKPDSQVIIKRISYNPCADV